MKYYSELTKQLYDTKEALQKAEIEQTKAKANRAERAKEVKQAYEAAIEANKKARKLLNDFTKDYGCYYTTITNTDTGEEQNPTDSDAFWDIFHKFLW